ncbi:MAG: conjugative transposon protein TraJ [Sphingobacteriales bacterium]
MKKPGKICLKRTAVIAAATLLLPCFCHAQGVAADLHSLQGVLNNLYNQMMPMCSGMIGVARALAGFAALWYIAARVWKHLAAAEPIDFYPLLRPFAIGFCIMVFPMVLALINGILQPTVTATDQMVTTSNLAIQRLLSRAQTNNNVNPGNADPDKYYQYAHPDNTPGTTSANTNPIADSFSGWGFKNMIKKAIAELLNVLFEAAALCLDTIRTFKLVVLAVLGPLCFGLSVFDGFQDTLKQWLARYINVFMWLPVANIFGAIIAKIQENMLELAQAGGAASPSFGDTNTAYLIFLLIGIVGYFTVPGIANYIVNVGGHALFSRTSALASVAVTYVGGAVLRSFTTNTASAVNPGGNMANQGHQSFLQDKLSGGNGPSKSK